MKPQIANGARHHLILLPGLDGTGRQFEPLLKNLPAGIEATVVRYPTDRPLHYRDLLPCIRNVIPWNNPYVVVAESVAGPLALKFVEAQRQDIRALVLCASYVTNPLPPVPKWPVALFRKSWLEKEPTPELVRSHLAGADAPDALVNGMTDALRALTPEVRAQRTQMILTADASAELQSCNKPILYLQAAQDQFVHPEALQEILRLKSTVRSAVVTAPHLMLQCNPREALEAIRKFLDELPQP